MKEVNRLDVVVCGIDEYSLSVGLFMGKTTRVPVFCVVEDPPFTDRYCPPTSWTRRQEKQVRQLILESLLKQCSGIFCFIERDVLSDFSLPNVPVYQLMNGVSPETLRWVQRQSRKEEKSSECVIGYVGAINRKQGIDDLLEIFAGARREAANLRLRLIGPIGNDYAQCYQERLCKLGLDSNVEITGWLPYEQMLDKLLECDICVHCNPPTEWSRAAQPLKVCEYLALRKPTVAWDYPGTRRLLGNGRLGILVSSGDKSAFTAALIRLVNPSERRTIEHEINVAVRDEWSSGYWYEEVLKRVMSSVLKKYEVKCDKSD